MSFVRFMFVVIVCACADTSPPQSLECDCDDGDPCTDDVCSDGGECVHVGSDPSLACLTDDHCRAASSCSVGRCEPVPGCGFLRCTLTDRVCDDGDPCSMDHCQQGPGCVFERLDAGGPCAAGCDDGDPCTDDGCQTFAECGDFCTHTPNGCTSCDTIEDCAPSCVSRACVDGICVHGTIEDPRCDWRCYAPSSVTPDDAHVIGAIRGIALPLNEHCAGCTCTRALVLRGEVHDLTMLDGDLQGGVPWGTCAVDNCEGETTCSPLRINRGYLVNGNASLATIVDGALVGPYSVTVDYFCLAVHSDLMLGDWRMTLTLDDGTTTTFDATVASADDGPTRFEISGTHAGIGIPTQTLLLPNGGFSLETRLATGRGELAGALYSGPEAIVGALSNPQTKATLRIEPAP